jgi:hypothetical protein
MRYGELMKKCLLKILLFLALVLHCHPMYGQDRREGYSTNIGIGLFYGNLGPIIDPSIAFKDLNILGELYFNYSVYLTGSHSDAWYNNAIGGYTFGINVIPIYFSGGRTLPVLGAGTILIKEKTGSSFSESFSGSVRYVDLHGGVRHFITPFLYGQLLLNYAILVDETKGLFNTHFMNNYAGEYDNISMLTVSLCLQL